MMIERQEVRICSAMYEKAVSESHISQRSPLTQLEFWAAVGGAVLDRVSMSHQDLEELLAYIVDFRDRSHSVDNVSSINSADRRINFSSILYYGALVHGNKESVNVQTRLGQWIKLGALVSPHMDPEDCVNLLSGDVSVSFFLENEDRGIVINSHRKLSRQLLVIVSDSVERSYSQYLYLCEPE